MNVTDLHMHSNISIDGEIEPEALAVKCKEAGLNLVALTDHNAVSGVNRFVKACDELGISSVKGTELDCMYGDFIIHVLGYNIDPDCAVMKDMEQSVQDMRIRKSKEMLDKIEAVGIKIDRKWIRERSIHGPIAAVTIAENALSYEENKNHPLIKRVRNNPKWKEQPYVGFYWEICCPGKPAYTAMDFMPVEEGIDIIHQAGGIAVLAHPGAYYQVGDSKIDQILQLPFEGIEAFSSYHDEAMTKWFISKAEEHGLVITGGSDYHGKIKPNIQLGQIDFLGREDEVRKIG